MREKLPFGDLPPSSVFWLEIGAARLLCVKLSGIVSVDGVCSNGLLVGKESEAYVFCRLDLEVTPASGLDIDLLLREQKRLSEAKRIREKASGISPFIPKYVYGRENDI